MSKKSKPRDGSNGRGTKGMRSEFEELFQAPVVQAKEETEEQQQDPRESEEAVS